MRAAFTRHGTGTIVRLLVMQASCLAVGLLTHGRILDAPAPTTGLYVLSFAWIGGLQGTVAWIVMSRIQQEQRRSQQRIREQELRHNRELVRTRNAVIVGLSKLSESRDSETGYHLERISLYSTRLAAALREHPDYAARITDGFLRSIGVSSVLHDIGKVGIEDSILLKPGRLSQDERKRMQRHAMIGEQCLKQIQARIGAPEFLEMAREIAIAHHERWDGNGYPHGLQGDEIPLAAQIVSIADVYDALSVRRVYKPAYPHEKCVRFISEGAGSQFNPDLVEVFLNIESEFAEIARRFRAGESGGTLDETWTQPELWMTDEEQSIIEQTVETVQSQAALAWLD